MTHWEECWLDPRHHACAVAEIQRLRAERDTLRAEVEALRAALRNVYGHVTNGNLEWPDALQLIEETCCTVMSDAERTLALCEYGEATE